MTTLHVRLPDGQNIEIQAVDGLPIMEALRPLDSRIIGDRGGSAVYPSCHVWVDEGWLDRLPPISDDEAVALERAAQARANSRLVGQLCMSPELDGLKLTIPTAAPAVSPSDDAGAPVDNGVGSASAPSSEKTRLKRYNWLAKYDRETINAIIDAGMVCQVGYVIDGMPYVTPTNHWRIDDHVYWHGSSASRMLKAQQKGISVCFTVTHLDGIVFSRAAFNHNVKFRSVMAFGQAEICDEDIKRHALKIFTDRLAPGLWDYARPPTELEWKASKVIRMRLDEVSGKVADSLPDEEAADYSSERWAGYVPLQIVQLPPVTDPKLKPGIAMPDFVRNFRFGG